MINFDLERTPLRVKTNTVYDESREALRVHFFTIDDQKTGGFNLYLNKNNSDSSQSYFLARCSETGTSINYPIAISSDSGKVWKITLMRTPEIRLLLHLNHVKILDTAISDTTCADETWITSWTNNVEKIKFLTTDTLSYFYKKGLLLQFDNSRTL